MEIKIFAFLFMVFMVQITLVKSWGEPLPSRATRKPLDDKEKNEFKETVKEFLETVTFGDLWKTRLWEKKSSKGFHDCMNEKSTPYNFAIADFRRDSAVYLNDYRRKSFYDFQYLIDEIKEYVLEICDLLDQVRNKFYLETQKKSFDEDLKRFRREQKGKIEGKLMAIHENMKTIKYHIRLDNHVADFDFYQQRLKKDFKLIQQKTVEFYKDIEKCMKT